MITACAFTDMHFTHYRDGEWFVVEVCSAGATGTTVDRLDLGSAVIRRKACSRKGYLQAQMYLLEDLVDALNELTQSRQ